MKMQIIQRVSMIIVILILFKSIQAQMLDITGSYIFPDNNIFNKKFIKENKVKTIIGEISTKKENDIIKKDGLTYQYEFNPKGKIIQRTNTYYQNKNNPTDSTNSAEKEILDEISVLYLYNDSTWLITRRSNEKIYGTYSHNFVYNKYGNVRHQSYTKDDIRSFFSYDYKYDKYGKIIKDKEYKKKPFELSSYDTIFYETYDFDIINDTKFKMLCFNNDDNIYKEVAIIIDNESNVINVSTEYLFTNKKSHYTYIYDDKKRIVKKTDYSNLFKEINMITSYIYDESNGNIIEENVSINNKPSTKTQYIYDEKKQFLHSQIKNNIPTNTIEIIKYSYEFYD